MKPVAGVWIDHRKAVVVTISDKEETLRKIPSNVERQLGRMNGKHSTTPFESRRVKADDRQQKGFTNKITTYFREVMASLGDAKTVLIFGPGEAKTEIMNLIKHDNHRGMEVIGESADKMTDHQIASKVRDYSAGNTMKKAMPLLAALVLSLVATGAWADTPNEAMQFGFKVRVGGRYDNVRMCVASPAGAKGGIAADISAFAEFPTGNGASLHVDLPVMRPILFAAAFHMLQFEPTVALKFSDQSANKVGWVAGPALGVSLHYGPDYRSESSGSGRTASFFAMGPILGAYAGLDFRRPGEKFNFQLGVSPYVTPLFGIGDPQDHRGVVIGGLLDGSFRFGG